MAIIIQNTWQLPIDMALMVYQGDTTAFNFDYLDNGSTGIDLSGYTAQFNIAESRGARSNAKLQLTQGAGITLNSSGDIAVSISSIQTASLDAGYYVYELQITSGSGATTTLLTGNFIVRGRVV